jgi:hypothetical protein
MLEQTKPEFDNALITLAESIQLLVLSLGHRRRFNSRLVRVRHILCSFVTYPTPFEDYSEEKEELTIAWV